jgi:hypothetical protein
MQKYKPIPYAGSVYMTLIDCYLTPNEQFLTHVMTRTSYIQ